MDAGGGEAGWVAHGVAVGAGLVAGFVNTLAGSGSFLTLPALILLGLPANVANATNRIGVLLAATVSVSTFRARGAFPEVALAPLVAASCTGAAAGALAAARIDPDRLDPILGALMLVMLALALLDPRRLLPDPDEAPRPTNRPATLAAFFAIGVYGGFIQAGVGLFLLTALVANVRVRLSRANAVKNLLVLLFTIPAVAIFAASGLIDWTLGLLLALGQMAGAWTAVHFSVRARHADRIIRWLLIVVLGATAAHLLGVADLVRARPA